MRRLTSSPSPPSILPYSEAHFVGAFKLKALGSFTERKSYPHLQPIEALNDNKPMQAQKQSILSPLTVPVSTTCNSLLCQLSVLQFFLDQIFTIACKPNSNPLTAHMTSNCLRLGSD